MNHHTKQIIRALRARNVDLVEKLTLERIRTQQLKADLAATVERVDEAEAATANAIERAERARRDARNAYDAQQEAEDRASYQARERNDALRDLERAKTYGNEYEEQRALDRLKRI